MTGNSSLKNTIIYWHNEYVGLSSKKPMEESFHNVIQNQTRQR